MVRNPLLWDANTPSMRKAITGMDDVQLTVVGYLSVLWNALERSMVGAIAMAANWQADLAELVTADIANVSRASLLMNLVRKNVDDQRLVEQTETTIALFDLLRGARNDLMHGFYNWKSQGADPPFSLMKVSTKKRTGAIEIKHISVAIAELEELATDFHLCNESFNDLYHKLHFRNRWNEGERGIFAQNYEDAVHGWREPSFDISFVQECLRTRSQRLNPPQPKSQQKASQAKSPRPKRRPD